MEDHLVNDSIGISNRAFIDLDRPAGKELFVGMVTDLGQLRGCNIIDRFPHQLLASNAKCLLKNAVAPEVFAVATLIKNWDRDSIDQGLGKVALLRNYELLLLNGFLQPAEGVNEVSDDNGDDDQRQKQQRPDYNHQIQAHWPHRQTPAYGREL